MGSVALFLYLKRHGLLRKLLLRFQNTTGAKIIAILGTIFTGLGVIGTTIAFGVIVGFDIHIGALSESGTSLTDRVKIPYTLRGEHDFQSQVWMVFGWAIAVQALYLAGFAMLLNGIRKASGDLIFPFLVIDMIGLLLATGITAWFIVVLICLAFGFYLWDVVYSVFKDFRNSQVRVN